MAVLCLVGLGAFVALTPVQVAAQVGVDAAGVAQGTVSLVAEVCPAEAEAQPPAQQRPVRPPAPPRPGGPAPERPVPVRPQVTRPSSPDPRTVPSRPGAEALSRLSTPTDNAPRVSESAPASERPAVVAPPAHAAPSFPVRPYRSALIKRPAPGGFSTVTLMVVMTTPAVLAAAALRPSGRSRSSRA